MTRYVFLLAQDPASWDDASPEVRQGHFDAHHAFEAHLGAHGALLASGALSDASTATTVSTGTGGERVVTDGPFVELTEQIAGYYDVELPDLDVAIAAARLLPSAYTVEIRPITVIEGYESV